MKKQSILAAALAVGLALNLAGCARKSRRPELPAAPLQASFTAGDTAAQNASGAQDAAFAPRTMAAEKPEAPIDELLEELVRPVSQEDALYQDYVAARRTVYQKLRSRADETLQAVLPELLEQTQALECYTDETSRKTILYCLMKDILQDEPFCWDDDSYRSISDMLAEFIQFVSGHALADGMDWFEENAPLTGLCAAVMREKPTLRLNMTPCEPIYNAQALTNAKLVFSAALEGRDAEAYGFDPWPDGLEDGFDFTTGWALSQDESGAVTLTATDPDTKEAVSLCYQPNEAEKMSLRSGYGSLRLTKADGEALLLHSENQDMGYAPATAKDPVQDAELVLENGVELGMDYNTVCALVGEPDRVWSDTMAGMGLADKGVSYSFQYDESLVLRLTDISFRFAEDTWLKETSELPAARGIRLGEAIESVFEKLPAKDTVLKRWALQEVYGWDAPENGQAELQFVADSFYSLSIRTPGGQNFSITFARLDNTVKWMDISGGR